MGLITLPYSFSAKTTAKAAEMMANFNKIVEIVNGNLTSANLAAESVTKTQLDALHKRKVNCGKYGPILVPNGFDHSSAFAFPHFIGETPSGFTGHVLTSAEFQNVIECRLLEFTSEFVKVQLILENPVAGETFFEMYWTVFGQG